MIKLVVCNQKGGVSKTTTTMCVSRCLAELGKKVLMIDTDSQGSLGTILNVKYTHSLYDFVVSEMDLDACIQSVHPNIDLLPSNKRTLEIEGILSPKLGRELHFKNLLAPYERRYDAVIIDVAPSLTVLQSCALMYTEQALIPLTMDVLSLQGAHSVNATAGALNEVYRSSVRAIGVLPVMVNRSLSMTTLITGHIGRFAEKLKIPIFQTIRTDARVPKANVAAQFLQDMFPTSNAAEDYRIATDQLVRYLETGEVIDLGTQQQQSA